MDDATPEPRCCEVCGDPIRENNKYGICTDQAKPACVAARRRKRLGLPEPGEKTCEICGKPLRCDNKTGICSDRGNSECNRIRKRMSRGAADPRVGRRYIIIKPGDTFGLLTALEDYDPKRKLVLCRCECGTEKRVRGVHLASGKSRSCGCARYETRADRKALYLTAGMVFNRLTVIEDVANCDDDARFLCECGNETTTKALSVKHGNTKSCGCLWRELNVTHGFSGHPLHELWNSIIQRCTNPNHAGHGSYSRLAIPICDRWRDPWLFAEDIYREIGPRPETVDKSGRALYSIDRIDNERGYEPGNVRWADRKTQRANQRTIAGLTRERDALAARLTVAEAELEALRRRRCPANARCQYWTRTRCSESIREDGGPTSHG
jgi:hypothetical protein